ncbi:MAG: Dam family site-specific DNA-(adenine-N6)-methyltransferase [Oscillatoriales cyanobacterium C42_A2020_001]|nr:Dam family site-specific DNA-(adenine-N6)-methyltransferase [Leptolyngbyaceae cyanobacterium C42_A2020_001]
MPIIVPPIKCQGIKTKLIPAIKSIIDSPINGTWIEPFCGSCVVAFNLKPNKAILSDTNQHVINFYRAIQDDSITPEMVSEHLEKEGRELLEKGEQYYYYIRNRFNATQDSLDFLFLNRSCFNGIMRFNQKGQFNVPFCRKPHRFAKPYVTKIVNQVRAVRNILHSHQWIFQVADFTLTLSCSQKGDLVYVDPPYIGRHVDYFNTWTKHNEEELITVLDNLPCEFILSTWLENKYRYNSSLKENWQDKNLRMILVKHFYHVGAFEELRNPMIEALVTNRAVKS